MKIKGFATVEVIDRDGDKILLNGVEWDNYIKTGGVLLFNHLLDRIVGKVISIARKNNGLEIVAEVFDEEIKKLIEKGVLKSFSVRGKVLDDNYDAEARVIKRLELYEISIVTIPANPEAIFEIIEKSTAGEEKSVGLCGTIKIFTEGNMEENKIEVVAEEKIATVEKVEEKKDNLEEINKSIVKQYEKLAEALGAGAREVKEAVDKKMSEIEKAVSLMYEGVETKQTGTAVQSVPKSKIFYSGGMVLEDMPTTSIGVPILGSATVTGEGTATDSNISMSMTLTAKQFTAKYPVSYYLETAGGQNLLSAIEENIKLSIAKKFDEVASTKTTGFFVEALDQASEISQTWSDAKTLYSAILSGAAAKGLDFSDSSEWNIYIPVGAFSILAGDSNLLTVDKIGDRAILVSGQIGTLFGMSVFVIPGSGTDIYACNKKFIATGAFGDWNYERGLDANGNTMIFGRKLLAFTCYLNGVLAINKA